ncbi:MAG: T9SS type A sorting domain-containing protein [Candidatus Cloacimonetes bacterium]|nr:T9SS type A sorting domain-containing protein [Candidatus Cloacimonadota bacterium]
MKNRTKFFFVLLFILAMNTLIFAQNAPIDFEEGGYGADWTWTVFENATNPPVEVVANPDVAGLNESATVGMITALQAGQPWAGCETLDIGEFTFTADNSTVSIMVHKDVVSDVRLKFEGTGAPAEINSTNTVTGEWEEIVYDFSGAIGNTYNKFVFFPDFDMAGRLQNNIIYYDNVTFSEQIAGNEPQVAAPAPMQAAEDVISVFSDSYEDLPGTNFNPPWGQSTIVSTPLIAGNLTLKYANFNYQGTQFSAAQDLSLMEFVHIDLWTADATVVMFTPISAPPGEFLVLLSPLEQETWNSIDIPLTDFIGLPMGNIFQLKFDGQQGVTPSTIYLDNIYFYKLPDGPETVATLSDLQVDGVTVAGFAPTTLTYDIELPEGTTIIPTVTATTTNPNAEYEVIDTEVLPGTTQVVVTSEDESNMLTYNVNFYFPTPVPQTAAPDPTLPGVSVISIFSDSYDDIAGTNFNPNWGQSTVVTFEEIAGYMMLKYDNFNYQGTAFAGSTDLSAMSFLHIDMWTPDATVVQFSPISATTGEHLLPLDPINSLEWNSYDILLSDFTGMTMADIIQLKFDGQAGVNPSTIYLDNIYFYSANVPGSDATLSDLLVDGVTIEGFLPSVMNYEVELAAGTVEVPVVTAVTNDPEADFVVNAAAMLPGTTEVVVTAEDGETMLTYNVNFTLADAVPEIAAPTPEMEAEHVISLYSNDYENVFVDTWSAGWDMADLEDIQIAGNDTKLYTNLVYAGIEFTSQTIDASGMTHFHMDIWTPDNTAAPSVFKVKLVDFGADGVWGGDDVEHEITFDETIMATETWVSLDIPFEDFTGLVTREHLAQLIISGDPNTVYVDNVYFYDGGPYWLYGDVTGDWSIDAFDAANLLQFAVMLDPIGAPLPWTWQLIAGDVDGNGSAEAYDAALVLQYSVDLIDIFPVQTRTGSSPQGRVDIKIENNEIILTGTGEVYSLQLKASSESVVFGNTIIKEGLLSAINQEEFSVALASPEIISGEMLRIPYNTTARSSKLEFTITVNGVEQHYKFSNADLQSGNTRELHAPIDFEAGGYGADWTWTVFENDYNPPVEILANPDVSGINTSATVMKFTALQTGQPWAGCESQHGSDLGEFSFDETNCTVKVMVWKPVISDVGVKFVEASGEAQPEVKVANSVINEWEELTFDLSGSIGAGITGIIDQIVIFPDFDLAGRTQDNICYIDNVTFHEQGAGPEGPEEPAPTPAFAQENVISLFSNAYTNVTVDTWSAEWDQANVTDVQVMGDDVKLYTSLVFAGIEFTSQTIDATAMNHFHMDIWTPDPTTLPAVFKIKLVDFGADGVWSGGDDVEHELTFDANTTPALMTGEWVCFDIPLSDFTGLTTTEHLAQLIISGDPNNVYVDNIYFHNNVTGTNEDNPIQVNSALGSNYPNPFNPVTTITFSLTQPGHVKLSVYDTKGRLVDTLVDGSRAANTYHQTWNADTAPSGVYFYRLSVDNRTIDTKRMILLK